MKPQLAKNRSDFRQQVIARDGRCLSPTCQGRCTQLDAHHVYEWAIWDGTNGHFDLRFIISNGITLCWDCHKAIKGREQHYIRLYLYVLSSQYGENYNPILHYHLMYKHAS